MYVFGGYDGISWLDDFYYLNLRNYKWTKIEPQQEWPSERFGFACGYSDGKMCIFGGFDGN